MDPISRGLRDQVITSGSTDELKYATESSEAGLKATNLERLDVDGRIMLSARVEATPSELGSPTSLNDDSGDFSDGPIEEPDISQEDGEDWGEGEHEVDYFNCLGQRWAMKFVMSGDLEDIDQAIAYHHRAVVLTPDGHADRPAMLNNLALGYLSRFEHSGDLADIEKAIEYQSQAVLLAPDAHEEKPRMLNNLGASHQRRFQRLGKLADLERAIECMTRALSLAPEGHEDRLAVLHNLGSSHHTRFARLGNAADIERAIECHAQTILITPDEDPNKPAMLDGLGMAYRGRFQHLSDLSDLDRAIECQSQAVILAPDGHAIKPGLLSNLGNSHRSRFEHLGELPDIERAIDCQSQAVLRTPSGHSNSPTWLASLGNSLQRRFECLGDLADIDRAIECQSQAIRLTPDGHAGKPGMLSDLGHSYGDRFDHLGDLIDGDRAIECLSQAVLLAPAGDVGKYIALNNLSRSYHGRFRHLGELVDIDRAIEYQYQAISIIQDRHSAMPGMLGNLGTLHLARFEQLREPPDIERAIECLSQAASFTPDGHASKPMVLDSLGNSYQRRFGHLGELADIDRAIQNQRQAVLLSPDGHVRKPARLNNLGNSHQRRFEHLGELPDLDRAVECHLQSVLLTPDGHADKPIRLENLGRSRRARFEHLGRPADMNHAISSFRMAALSPAGSFSTRFKASRKWAQLASIHDKASCIAAYQVTMELVPKVAWIGSTASRRYKNIHSIGDVATEAATAAITQNEYASALEWLEAGRSIVWNQTLQLRTQFDDLSAIAPDLAGRLKHVARDLEFSGLRTSDTIAPEDNARSLEAAAQNHRRLAEQYEELITQARDLPGFHDFMRPKKAAELMSAARSGPVVVINLHAARCAALIIRPNSDKIAHLPLPEVSHAKVNELYQQMQGALLSKGIRERGFRRLGTKSGNQFESILAALWSWIAHPVLVFLGYETQLPVEQLPHITWCTTGALSFLPLHAAGCYDPAGNNIFNFAVSSYAPNLSALIHLASRSFELGGILAVSQEATTGCTPLPGTKAELAHIRPHAGSRSYMELENDRATAEAVLEAMGEYSSVHLACHASQNIERPTDSCFYLHDGSLTLAQITKKSLQKKGMAFLSACQTATGDKGLPDEAIHLAAGMLVAGYPTVIATMWSISDEDAPSIADGVYGRLVVDGRLDNAKAARALHAAVGALRAQVGELAFVRWVPYIHIGI